HEVRYYDEKGRKAPAVVGNAFGDPVPLPYGAWYLEAMDSHGGWIASAPDLVRYAAAFDDPGRRPILKAESVKRLFARPQGPAGYDTAGKAKTVYQAYGWQVRVIDVQRGTINAWHDGALDGTSTFLMRRHDGLSVAVLFNSRHGPTGSLLSSAI